MIALVASLFLLHGATVFAQVKAPGNTTGNASALFISPEGNVGIGTDNVDPHNKLQLNGNLHMDGNSIYFRKDIWNTSSFMRWNNKTDRLDLLSFRGIALGQTVGNNDLLPIVTVGTTGLDADGRDYTKPAVDIASVPRSATDYQPKIPLALYVGGDINQRNKGIQFRQSDGRQGIGFTMNAIYTAGSMDNQDLNLEVTGGGNLIFKTSDQNRMFINNTGNVTINTNLDVKNSIKVDNMFYWDEYRFIQKVNSPGSSCILFKNTMTAASGNPAGGFAFFGMEATPLLRLRNNFVGIGTDNPEFPLDVRKKEGSSNYDYQHQVDNDNSHELNERAVMQTASRNRKFGNCSILAQGDIVTKSALVATSTGVYSDIRLKKDIRPSSSQQDLETLRHIEIANYKMIDTIADNRQYKKVIAQQVQRFYPLAINSSFNTLPDVFQLASSVSKLSDSIYIITLAKPQHLQTGDKVDLKCPDGVNGMAIVTRVNNNKSVTVKSPLALDEQKSVFVYGKRVDDVLTVDYDAISMLNVSATQQLAKIIDEQQKKINELTRENEHLRNEQAATKSTIDSILVRLAKLDEAKNTTASTIVVATVPH